MLDKMIYRNSKGQEIQFGSLPFLINYSDFRDYSWSITVDSNRSKIQSFSNGITTKKLPIIVKSEGNCREHINHLFNVIQYDVVYNSAGKLCVGDYFMEGYFYASKKKDYLESEDLASIELEFVSEDGVWKKIESVRNLHQVAGGGASVDEYLTYPIAYPYDYKAGSGVLTLTNASEFECDFIMTIWGYCKNPTVRIGLVDYAIKTTVYAGEWLVINSKEKTVVRYKPDRTMVDEFNNRSRESNVFNKIPAGHNALQHNITNRLDIDLIYERSEPLWI